MKKFLTVLLVIAVMFTFSFGTAMAAGTTTTEGSFEYRVSQAEAEAIKALNREVEDFAATTLSVGSASTLDISKETQEAYVVTAKADVLDDIYEKTDDILADPTTNGAKNIAQLTALYSSITLANEMAGATAMLAMAKTEFAAEKAEYVANLNTIDLSVYSKTTPTVGKTYYQAVYDLVEKMKVAVDDAALGTTGTLDDDVDTGMGALEAAIEDASSQPMIQEIQISNGSGTINTGVYELTSDGKTAAATGAGWELGVTLKTIKEEAAGSVTDEALAATSKARVQKLYADYIITTNADKTFADAFVKVWNLLADEGVAGVSSALDTIEGYETTVSDLTNAAMSAQYAAYKTAVSNIADLEAYAAKYKAEKDAAGNVVRDAAEIDDIVTEAAVNVYKNLTGIATSSTDFIGNAKVEISKTTVDNSAAELAFKKEAAKTVLNQDREDVADNYFALEYEKVNAKYDALIANIEAAKTINDFNVQYGYYTNATAFLTGIKDKGDVRTLIGTTLYTSAFRAQKQAADNYLGYLNSGLTRRDAGFRLEATLNADLIDMFGENGARTAAEIKALSSKVNSVVEALPTVGTVGAAKTALEDAIKALPAKITLADADAVKAAFAKMVEYRDLTGASDVANTDISNYSTLKDAVDALYAADLLALSKKIDDVDATTDKATLKALLAEIEAFLDNQDEDEVYDVITSPYNFATEISTIETALNVIKGKEAKAVENLIAALPLNITELNKAQVEAARKAFDAYVAEWTDNEDVATGYVANDISNYRELALAEATFEVTNEFTTEDAKAYVQDLSIKARSTKTSKGVKVTINADVQELLDNGYTVEYKFYRSTKSNKNFGTAKVTKTTNTYLNTSGVKGTKYYYKAKLVVKNAAGEVVATTPLTQCLYATRTF